MIFFYTLGSYANIAVRKIMKLWASYCINILFLM